MRFAVLFVCTGNICRSPTAERLLRHRLRAQLGPAMPFDVTSGGTGALVGEPIYPDAARLLIRDSIDVADFTARDVTRSIAESADVVLAMTRSHRATIARLAPRTLPKLFTLREFARLLAEQRDTWPTGADPVARARALLALAQQRRAQAGPVPPSADDVPDPFRGSAQLYDEAWTLISAAVDVIVDAFTSG